MSAEAHRSNGPPVFLYTGDAAAVPKDATHVRVDPSVTHIHQSAFNDCHRLKHVELSEGLLKIEDYAFQACKSLARVKIPSTVTILGNAAFFGCSKLLKVELPEGLLEIGSYAFSGCESLEQVTIPSTVKRIPEGAFEGCEQMVHVDLPDTVEDVGFLAFQSCKSLRRVKISLAIKAIPYKAFANCIELAEIKIPDSVQSIGWSAFGDTKIQNLRIPPTMKKIGISSFDSTNMVSLELPEDLDEVEGDPLKGSFLPYLRNVALPHTCTGGEKLFHSKPMNEIRKVLAFKNREDFVAAMQQRFDGLVTHKICYYQSYNPVDVVLRDLKQAIEKESGGMNNASANQSDILGMTPLHILACSTVHHLDVYSALVEAYPEYLITKDKWGDTPMLYALWINTPKEILHYLIKSHKSYFPDYLLDWKSMLDSLAKENAPLECFQNTLDAQHKAFPDYKMNRKEAVTEWATDSRYQWLSSDTFVFLLKLSISDRLDKLNVVSWRGDIDDSIDNKLKWHRSFAVRKKSTEKILSKLDTYEQQKESITLLELALWKMKIYQVTEEYARSKDDKPMQKRVRLDHSSGRVQSRLSCSAAVVIPNVVQFLW